MRVRASRGLQSFLAVACVAALSACDDSRNSYVAPPPPKVQVAQPIQRPVTQYFELTGNTQATKSVDLEARVEGFLESIDYLDGAMVKEGDLLFKIQPNTYRAEVDQAKAELQSRQAAQVGAQQQYDRQVTLSRQGVTTETLLDNAKASLDEANAAILNAQASLDLADINLGYTRVVAPFAGRVTNHLVDVGALVGVSGPTKLATIFQTDPLYVVFNVSEPQVLAIKESMAQQGVTMTEADLPKVPVEIGLRGEEGYPHKGHLDYVAPAVDPSTGTLMVRGVIENKDDALLPGLFARVRVPVGHYPEALLVRNDSIGSNQQGNYVLVLGNDNVIELRVVETGERDGQLRVIKSGLKPDDWVVVAGVQRAAPGAKVEPEKVTM